MNFFKHFNKVDFQGKEATNIMNSILLKFKNINNTTLYFYYTIKDGESPESIAHKVYGESDLHWTILLLNHIVDPYYDWALGKKQLKAYIDSKYDKVNDIHHFLYLGKELHPNQSFKIDGGGYMNFNELYNDWLNGNPIPQNVFIISNVDFETTENDKRRDVKILNKDIVDKFVDQFIELMAGRIGNATL